MPNHKYEGKRVSIDGHGIPDARVTCDGKPLPPRNDVYDHSPDGFEWGYEGSGPAQLALAILVNEYGENMARLFYQEYKWLVIARLQQREWILTSEDVAQGIAEIRRRHIVKAVKNN